MLSSNNPKAGMELGRSVLAFLAQYGEEELFEVIYCAVLVNKESTDAFPLIKVADVVPLRSLDGGVSVKVANPGWPMR